MSTIVISYDGNDITDDVIITDAVFVSMVNGNPGTCTFRVRDTNRDKSFTVGKKITVDVDSNRVWAGYLMSVNRAYAFPAEDTDPTDDITRFLILKGADVNILFKKRVLHKDTNIKNVEGPTYDYPTDDTYAISQLVNHWIDLDPEIDAVSLVENVGTVNIGEQKWTGYGGGVYWGVAMDQIARTHGAVYYLTPDYKLLYADVDSANSPYVLTDNPTSSGDIGYREFMITHDGAGLINDSLIWGAGGGSPSPVISRKTDSTSVGIHGLWQFGGKYQGVWKQTTINKINNSIVDGTPANKRGAKNDRVSVDLTTHSPVFLPGYKVPVYSTTHGWNDTLPIRRMETRFISPTDPVFRLTLSHEIDRPFDGLIDPVRISMPRPPGYDLPKPPEIIIVDPPPPGGCTETTCGITDTFTRTLSGSLGNSDSGMPWTSSGTYLYREVDGSTGRIGMAAATPGVTFGYSNTAYILSATSLPYEATFKIRFNNTLMTNFRLVIGTGTEFEVTMVPSTGEFILQGWTGESGHVSSIDWTTDHWVHVLVTDNGGGYANIKGSVWEDGTTEPSWMLSYTDEFSEASSYVAEFRTTQVRVGGTPYVDTYAIIDDFDVVGVNRCLNGSFDDFEGRTETNGWGIASGGFPWVVAPGVATAPFSVTGGHAVADQNVSGGDLTIGAGPFLLPGDPAVTPYEVTFEFVQDFQTTQPIGGPFFYDNVFYLSDTYDLSGDWAAMEIANQPSTQFGIWDIYPWHPTVAGDNYQEDTINTGASYGTDETEHVFVKLGLDSYGMKGKVWLASETEPASWMVYHSDNAPMTPGTFVPQYVVIQPRQNADPGSEFRLYNISVAYDGDACFYEDSVIDSFTRSYGPITAAGDDQLIGTNDLGFEPWIDLGGSSVDSESLVIDGSMLSWTTDWTISGFSNFRYYFDGGWPVVTDAADLMGAPGDITMRFRFSELPVGSPANEYIEIDMIADQNGGDWPTLEVLVSNDFGSVGFDIGSSVAKTDWVADSWYTIKYNKSFMTHRAKVWRDGTSEPNWQCLYTSSVAASEDSGGLGGYFELFINQTYWDGVGIMVPTSTLDIDTIVGPGSGVTGSAGSVNAYLCESISTYPGMTSFSTSKSWRPGSTEVYLNGLFLARGIDYEETDWLEGDIALNVAIQGGDQIRVCYDRTDASTNKSGGAATIRTGGSNIPL